MVLPLDHRAWLRGDDADRWPRSRYSGTALFPNELAISLIVSRREIFGHSLIAFEWYADEMPPPRERQRRHEVFHLVPEPTASERQRGLTDAPPKSLLSLRARPARVALETASDFLPWRDPSGRVMPACFRSWLVPFADGWRARQAALRGVAHPPDYNYFGLNGGLNCAGWVLGVADHAGIDARHRLSRLVAVPKLLITDTQCVDDEARMWERRRSA